jgi:hypothetical protein
MLLPTQCEEAEFLDSIPGFKDPHEFLIAASNLGHRGMARYPLRTPVNEWAPETGAAHRKAEYLM